ncbi:MAG: hypothetical protein JSR30_00255 [Proteobacteria bacterium]|nr:hypothetical protein [Pseudomonadota bacterium]
MALDLATVTGWAMLANGVVTSGSQSFARHAGNQTRAPDHPGASFSMFDRWLHAKIIEDKPAVIVAEGAAGFFKSATAQQMNYGLRSIMLMNACRSGLPVATYYPTTVKKFWCGHGFAKKPQMVAETERRFPGINLTDDNESDAIALMFLHLSFP